MTDRELMQQALDALEGYARNCRCEGGGAPCDAAEALRARLAQPEQEPVAWRNTETGEFSTGGFLRNKLGQWMPLYTSLDWAAIYTAPPQREWQGLTEAERVDILDAELTTQNTEHFALAQAIEAKLKEKNG